MNDDLISRSALKTEIQKIVDEEKCIDEKWASGLGYSIKIIDNAPTVEVTDYDTGYQDGLEDGLYDIRPQGEWQFVNHYARPYRVCTVCHTERLDDKSTGWNFCPNCGADMRGDDNE